MVKRRPTVKKRRIILLAIAGAIGLVAAVSGLSRRAGPEATVQGYLRPEDVPQIQRAVRRDRWEVAKACLTSRKFKLFFGLYIPDTAFGRVREIGSLLYRTAIGLGPSITNASSRAYALSDGWYSRRSVKYALERTTNWWEVTSFGYQQ